mgnify:CR=1 FL=1
MLPAGYYPRIRRCPDRKAATCALSMKPNDRNSDTVFIDAEILRALLEQATVSAWVIAEDENILYANNAASVLSGYDREELVGMRISALMDGETGQRHCGSIRSYLQQAGGKSSVVGRSMEFDLLARNGRRIPVEFKAFDLYRRQGGRHLFGALISDNRAHKTVEHEMKQLARIDHLTQCLNRLGFLERAQQEISRSRRLGHPLSLVVMDIDRFKQVNDQHGHQAGDRVLADLSSGVLRALRSHDVVGRVGGEEFYLLLPESDRRACIDIAERLRADIAGRRVTINSSAVWVTASLGCAELRPDDELDTLIHRADHRMYEAKNAGRNRVFPPPEPSQSGNHPAAETT